MNIGLEVFNTQATKPVLYSTESILESYTSCEAMFSNTDRFTEYGTQLFNAFDNIVSLGRTAVKFGSTEGLAVINALVKNDFHGTFSVEVAQGYSESIWGKIKAFFAKIWNWIKMFFQKIISLFKKTDGRLKKLLNDLNILKKQGGQIKEWRYIGLPQVYANLTAVYKVSAGKIDAAKDGEAVDKVVSESTDKKAEAASFGNSVLVRTVDDSIAKVDATIKMLDSIDGLRSEVEKNYNTAKSKVENMSKKASSVDIDAAKLEMKKANAKVKWVNKIGKMATRSAMSILANCKPGKVQGTALTRTADGKNLKK